MYSKCWHIIRDDSKRTFEVFDRQTNNDSFMNQTHAMQKAGMNVSCMTPPVTNKMASKDIIKVTGYSKEAGLYERLLNEYKQITLRAIDPW